MAKATFTLNSVAVAANTKDLDIAITRAGACSGPPEVSEVDVQLSVDGVTWTTVGGGQYGCSQIGTSSTPLSVPGAFGGDQAFWAGGTRYARLHIIYGDATETFTTAVPFTVAYRPIFPEAPATRITEAWETQKENFVSDYESADDGSGSIANVGSPPVPHYVQTYEDAVDNF